MIKTQSIIISTERINLKVENID